MPKYKLIYVDLCGRAETARMLFKLGGQEFEDCRMPGLVPTPDQTKDLPFGILPILEIDGFQLCQSNTINRYLARQYGYAGKDPLSVAKVDMIVDCVEDLVIKTPKLWALPDGEERRTTAKKYKDEVVVPGFEMITKFLEANDGGNGFFVGESLTIADLAAANLVRACAIATFDDTIWQGFPKLKALIDRVEEIPAIAAWIKERPVTLL